VESGFLLSIISEGLHPTARLPAAPSANLFLFGSHSKYLIQTVLQKRVGWIENYFLLIQKAQFTRRNWEPKQDY
jgi:hypothetical protein